MNIKALCSAPQGSVWHPSALHTEGMGIVITTFYHEQGETLTHAHVGTRAHTLTCTKVLSL